MSVIVWACYRDVKKQEALWNYTLQCLKERISADLLEGLSIEDMAEEDKEKIQELLKTKSDK